MQFFRSSLSYHLQIVIKIFVLSIVEWPFYTGFTVLFQCEKYNVVHDSAFLSSALFLFFFCFSKLTSSKNYLRNTIRVSNSLDPDQT